MKIGLVMPICTTHAMQVDAWASACENSQPDTPFYVLLNGITPSELPPLPDRIQVLQEPARFEDEKDLWDYCLRFAVAQGWDWCMLIHDDFRIMEPGWEADLALSEGWRVAIASWLGYGLWNKEANSGYPTDGHLAVTFDSMSFGFNVPIFAERGFITDTRWGYGFASWEANGWALQNDYAVWHILGNSWHQWIPNENTRTKLELGAQGHPEIRERYFGISLPSRVIDTEHIEIIDRTVRIAPLGATDQPRVTHCIDAGQEHLHEFE